MADDNVITLPVIRIERYEPEPIPDGVGDQETIGSLLARKRWADGPKAPRPTKRKLGAVAMRKALNAVADDAWTMQSCFLWMRQVMEREHDTRALAALIEHWGEDSVAASCDPARSWEECQRLLEFLTAFMSEYQRRFPMPRPKAVK